MHRRKPQSVSGLSWELEKNDVSGSGFVSNSDMMKRTLTAPALLSKAKI